MKVDKLNSINKSAEKSVRPKVLGGEVQAGGQKGEYFIEDMKCNFDVEIGVDMLLDCERNSAETFVLWSGDSDFADPIRKLISTGKKVCLFATAGRISSELNELRESGLKIFDIFELKEFICWPRESAYKRTKDPVSEAL